jgi:hypothetical protein
MPSCREPLSSLPYPKSVFGKASLYGTDRSVAIDDYINAWLNDFDDNTLLLVTTSVPSIDHEFGRDCPDDNLVTITNGEPPAINGYLAQDCAKVLCAVLKRSRANYRCLVIGMRQYIEFYVPEHYIRNLT